VKKHLAQFLYFVQSALAE